MSDFDTHTEDFADYTAGHTVTGRKPSEPVIQNFPVRTADGAKIKAAFLNSDNGKMKVALSRSRQLYLALCEHYNRDGIQEALDDANLNINQVSGAPGNDDERMVLVDWYCSAIHAIFAKVSTGAGHTVKKTFLLQASYLSGFIPTGRPQHKAGVNKLRMFLAQTL